MAKLIPLGIIGKSGLANFSDYPITSGTYLGAAYVPLANGSWFIFGGSDTGTSTSSYRYSTTVDGTYTTGTLPGSRVSGRAAASPTRLLVTSQTSNTTGFYTDNGTTWTSTTIFGNGVVARDCIWDGTRFLALSEDGTTNGLAYSTDAVSWSRIDIGNGGYTIRYDGTSRYIILQDIVGTATARTCTAAPTSAANWSDITLPSSSKWIALAYGAGIWVAINTGLTYATSTDGTSWTSRTLPERITADSAEESASLVFANGYFYYAAGSATNITVYSSSDGINWRSQTFTLGGATQDLQIVNAWAYSSNEILGVGYATETNGADRILVGK